MTSPQAKDMGAALRYMANLLVEADIAAPETSANVDEAATSLIRQGKNTAWSYQLDTTRPIVFAFLDHAKRGGIQPRISAHISVKDAKEETPPFEILRLSLEITDIAGGPVQRWHMDRANHDKQIYQDGPLYHLQLGGHWPGGDRQADIDLAEPRWCHPPLDVVLLAEVVVANFYPRQWRELHAKPGWCNLVRDSQKLCFTGYLSKMSSLMNVSQSTALAEMWAQAWGP